jgi:hypothetical protein
MSEPWDETERVSLSLSLLLVTVLEELLGDARVGGPPGCDCASAAARAAGLSFSACLNCKSNKPNQKLSMCVCVCM